MPIDLMSSESGDYLKHVVATSGPDCEIMDTNCGGKWRRRGDYIMYHGKAGELLGKWKKKWEGESV